MYAGNYGYPNNPAGSPQYNGGAPPPGSHNSAMQPGTSSNQMMYNAQHFPMGAQSAAAFPGNPSMMPGVAPPGMMQNTGMPHMATPNGQMSNFQPPYSNSAYGAGIPSSVPPQMNIPPNYAMGGGMPMAGFPMQQGMSPQQQQQQQQQHMMQRMQASQPNANMSTPTPQRNFPAQPSPGAPGPGNGPALQQSQFPGPPNAQGTPHGQPTNNTPQQHQQHHHHQQQQQQHQQQQQQQQQQQVLPPSQTQAQAPSSNSIQTPQTPTFPAQAQGNSTNGVSSGYTPLSPGADPKDKERVGVILEINNELLLEAMQIQSTQHTIKKERAAMNDTDGNTNEGEKKSPEEEQLAQDYVQLQTNLAYLAGLADKERKPTQPSHTYPAYLKPPPLNTSIKLRQVQAQEGSEVKTAILDREETAKYIGELYKRLQALFPDIDPNKEPSVRPTAPALNSTQSGSHTPGQASPVPGKQPTPTLATSAPPQPATMGIPAP